MPTMKHLIAAAVAGALLASPLASPTLAQTTQPADRPATRPADLTEFEALFVDAAEAYEALPEDQQQAIAQGPRVDEASADAAKEALEAFVPLFERAAAMDLDAVEPPAADVAALEPRRYTAGINPLVSAVLAVLSPAVSDDEASAEQAAQHAVAVAGLMVPLSAGESTGPWFSAANADAVIRQTVAGRAGSITPATLRDLAAVPPLEDFNLVTGREGEALAAYMRASDELPDFVPRIAEQRDIADDEIATWRQEWADPERREQLINEYELYFDVEVELARLRDEPERMEQFLTEWEAGHERDSLWLSRYTLVSPREAYELEFRQRAIRDLFAVVAAGRETDDLQGAILAAGSVTGGGKIQGQGGEGGRLLLIADVPLGDRPAIVPVGR